jgi:lysozyme family protein
MGETMANFELAIPTVLTNEGGYVNDPDDPGGETNFGISKRSYPSLDIKHLTVEDATAIYLRYFWKFGGIEDQAVATKLFDAYVNMKSHAIKAAQEVTQLPIDGVYGPHTEAAINNMAGFLAAYRNRLVQYYLDIVTFNPEDAKFLDGWLRRARQ